MSNKGNFYIPTKLVNGVPTKVILRDWVQQTLGADELIKFDAADERQKAIFSNAIATGTVIATVITDNNNEPMGATYEFTGVVTDDSEWKSYSDRYEADTSLTWPADHRVTTSTDPVAPVADTAPVPPVTPAQ
jgi:hypothetical protein